MSQFNPRQSMKLRRKEEAHSRRSILYVLSAALDNNTAGWCSAKHVMDILESFLDQKAAPKADEYKRLLRELYLAGYLDVDDQRESPHEEDETLFTMHLRITANGVKLLNRTIDADPLVEDIRIKL